MTSTRRRRGGHVEIFAALFLFTIIHSLTLVESVNNLVDSICDPKEARRAHAGDRTTYYECDQDKKWSKRSCPAGELFDATAGKRRGGCVAPAADDGAAVDPAAILSQPQYQAPDDICSGGIPLTRLSAPVACNPTASSCPDGYHCTLHSRTGTSYCCQNVVELSTVVDSALCTSNQITYFDPLNGLPKSCVLNSPSSCPIGFGCNLVGGAFTRCCGRNFGCPANSAGFAKPHNGAHLQCNAVDPSSCPAGFVCTHSSMFNTGVCCSDTSTTPVDVCGGDAPLSRPNPCSASAVCPAGYACRNGRCCPSKGLCPAGNPLGGVTSCSASNPCPNNYQCVTTNGQQYCCPAPEHVCRLPRDAGAPCESRAAAATRFYFDAATGSCRAFQFSQCGGNGNNFDTLEQCESFCLDAQCPHGAGLRAGPALATCVVGSANGVGLPASAGAVQADSVCPSHYTCAHPLFGNNNVCCTSNENVCRDTVTSGTACFGPFTTIQRFHYNAERDQCEPFQYYGCNGSGNNFLTKRLCENACQPPVRNACNGVAPLNDEGDYVQRCSDTVPCAKGSWCNSRGYCCPHPETACQAPRSIGHTCLSQRPGTYWYFDTAADTCLPFIYSGCGGTPNRFASREACEQMCVSKLGDCPRGMTPFLAAGWTAYGGQRQCSLNVAGSCPEGSSCVLSTLNEPICCTSTAQCPVGRAAYVIPGSDSHVACLPDDNNCPHGHQCMQSSNIPGFYMCCSAGGLRRWFPSSPSPANAPRVAALIAAVQAGERRGVGALALAPPHAGAHAPKCPAGLASNGQRCTINEIEGCPHGYLCIGSHNGAGGSRGVCCKATPKCHKRRKPYFVGKKQVLTCGDDEAGCPRGSACTPSSIDGVEICCLLRASASAAAAAPLSQVAEMSAVGEKRRPANSLESESDEDVDRPTIGGTFSKVAKVVPKCRDGALPYFALGSRVPQSCKTTRDDECPEEYECNEATDAQHYCCPAWDRCPNNASPFLVEGSRKPLGCNWMANNCPEGYSCEGSKDRAICCRSRPSAAQCPSGRSAYLYAKRPLICPPGKRTCPSGYECLASRAGGVYLCCSDEERASAECVSGRAYFDPATNKNQLCNPALDACPSGYECSRSTLANAHVCCSDNNIGDNRYDGYCPPGQIPYTGMKSDYSAPTACHMAKSPCPTTAPYQCIYSPEKQNSYCCAPVDTTHRPSSKHGSRSHSRKGGSTSAGPKVDDQQQQQQMWMQQQQQSYQQQLQYQQKIAAAEYASAAAAAAVKPPAASGCANAAIAAAMYPDPSSEMIQQQQLQYQQQTRPENQPQYPSTTVIDPSAANKLFVASCPPRSKPLLNPQTQLGHACSPWNRCPSGFTCYSNFPDGRNAHCCTTVPLDNQVVFRANTPEAEAAAAAAASASSESGWPQQFTAPNQQIQYAPETESSLLSPEINASAITPTAAKMINSSAIAAAFAVQCPQGTVNIGGQCKRMYFVGQQGCDSDLQCRQRTNGTHCLKNYCSCDPGLLMYESRCIRQCPDGFLNIAGRCHDLTTVVFMDSVEERVNGTIGGYCTDTVVREEQCNVPNAYCNERSITCQCLPGYELNMDFGNKNDTGSCELVEDSKYNKTAVNETKLEDGPMEMNDNIEKTLRDDEKAPGTFFIIGDDDVVGGNPNVTVAETPEKPENNSDATATSTVEDETSFSSSDTTMTSNTSLSTTPSHSSSEATEDSTKFTTAPKDIERIMSTKFNGTLDGDFFFQSDD